MYVDEHGKPVEEEPEEQAKDPEAGYFEVWEENWEAAQLFRSLSTQWIVIVGLGGAVYQGLDYNRVEATMRLMGIESSLRLFQKIQTMEAAGAKAMNDH